MGNERNGRHFSCRQRHPRKAGRFKSPAASRTPPPTHGAIGRAPGKPSHDCEHVLRFHRRAHATQHRRVKTPKRRWSKHSSRPKLRLGTQFCIGCGASSVHRATDEMRELRACKTTCRQGVAPAENCARSANHATIPRAKSGQQERGGVEAFMSGLRRGSPLGPPAAGAPYSGSRRYYLHGHCSEKLHGSRAAHRALCDRASFK